MYTPHCDHDSVACGFWGSKWKMYFLLQFFGTLSAFFFILDHQSGCQALCMMRKFLACILYSVSFPCTLLSWSLHKRFRFIRNTRTYAFTLPFPDPRFLPKRMAGSDLGKRKRKGISICSAWIWQATTKLSSGEMRWQLTTVQLKIERYARITVSQ